MTWLVTQFGWPSKNFVQESADLVCGIPFRSRISLVGQVHPLTQSAWLVCARVFFPSRCSLQCPFIFVSYYLRFSLYGTQSILSIKLNFQITGPIIFYNYYNTNTILLDYLYQIQYIYT